MRLWRTKQNHVLGHVLIDLGLVSQKQIDEALEAQGAGDPRPVGAILVDRGYLGVDDVEVALMLQKVRRGDMTQKEGLRILEQAVECTKRAAGSMEELTVAAEELAEKAKE